MIPSDNRKALNPSRTRTRTRTRTRALIPTPTLTLTLTLAPNPYLAKALAERGVPTPVAGAPPPKLFNRVVRL